MGFYRYLRCLRLHRIILMILFLGLIYIGYAVYSYAEEYTEKINKIKDMLEDTESPPKILRIQGYIIMADGLLGVVLMAVKIKRLLKLLMVILIATDAYLMWYLCASYKGANGTTIAIAKDVFQNAYGDIKTQNPNNMALVERTERELKCCGFYDYKDYKNGYTDSCCDHKPPCEEKSKVFELGCGDAIDRLVKHILLAIIRVLLPAILYILLLIIYVGIFCFLMRVRDERLLEQKKKNELAAEEGKASETVEVEAGDIKKTKSIFTPASKAKSTVN